MNLKSANIDMLHGPLTKNLLLFTLPIALSSILQQLFNAADTAVVGYFGNADALAAVGTNTEIIALIVTTSSGLAVGVNVLIAALIGKDHKEKIPAVINTALLLSVLIGFIGLVQGQILAGPLLRFIQTPDAILPDATAYLRIYLLGYPFLLLYDFGSAILRAQGDSRYPFLALALSGIVNVGLNLFLVVVFHMGVAGVSIATDLSNMLAALIVLRQLLWKDPPFPVIPGILHIPDILRIPGILRIPDILDVPVILHVPSNLRIPKINKPLLSSSIALGILKVGLPSALQGAVFCFANIFVQASVNTFGETAISGSTVAMNFEYFTYYIITAFGQTATTFIGQNHAAGDKKRCKKILCFSLLFSTICSSIPIFTIVLCRDFFSGLFTPSQAVVESAAIRILCILAFEPLCNLYEIPAGVLRGSGHALYPAISTMVGTCAFRILWICLIFPLNPTLPMLYHAFPLSWCTTIILVNAGFLLIRFRNRTDPVSM